MKKLFALMLALVMVVMLLPAGAAFADDAESVEYTTAEYEEPFLYSKSDAAFTPYKKNACEQQGTIVPLEYDTPAYMFNELLGVDETLHKKLYVYLPYGYDASQQYSVLYLMHGGGDSQEYWLGKDK